MNVLRTGIHDALEGSPSWTPDNWTEASPADVDLAEQEGNAEALARWLRQAQAAKEKRIRDFQTTLEDQIQMLERERDQAEESEQNERKGWASCANWFRSSLVVALEKVAAARVVALLKDADVSTSYEMQHVSSALRALTERT